MEFFKVPEALQLQHEKLRATLTQAIDEGGRIGEAAKAVAAVLRPHVIKEEEFGLPALGLLPHLVAGKISPVMRGVIAMTDRLKAQYQEMLGDHEVIIAAIHKLMEAARQENKPEYVLFAHKLILHARTEEQVFYPAAILIGEYLKLKLGTGVQSALHA
jgi:Hemerythrin HHE cation binding domain